MAWFKRERKRIDQPTPPDERRVKTEGLWTKCESCRAIVWKKDLEANWRVCPKCQHHFRLNATQRLELLLDSRWAEYDAGLASNDPLHFSDTRPYASRLKEARRKLGMADAILTVEGLLGGRPVICCSMEFNFIGGSMGAVVGEKVTRAVEMCIAKKLPLVIVSCSGGARMMEGTISLMQLAKVSAALARLDDVRLPFISVLTDPTTGGVTASYAMLGDINIAEPGALIGFAGPRVIEQTIRQKLPKGFQTAEFLLEHGFLDAVVHRKDLKTYISSALDFSWLDRMTYEESVRYLLTLGRELASPQQARAAKFDLVNITTLCEHLGQPQRAFQSVHIAGTNGKGSTAAMLDSILRAAGIRAGLYTSPHLERINERIRVSGEDISDADFAAAFTRLQKVIEELLAAGKLAAHPTFFECVTALAFDYFASSGVQFAVCEVGMGGRLDATNILSPEVAVITQIDFDHENYLGHSIEAIAAEKAGIIKPGARVVSAAENLYARAVIRRCVAQQSAFLVEIEASFRIEDATVRDGCYSFTAVGTENDADTGTRIPLSVPLPGRFQIRNALTAVATARLLAERGAPIGDDAITLGIAKTQWPGRLERIAERPAIYLDGAHNPAGAREIAAFWEAHLSGRNIFLIYGAMRDKAVDEIAGLLFPRASTVILTSPAQPRTISATVLEQMTGHYARRVEVVPNPNQALERALELAEPEDVIFVTGSLYLVGDLRQYWLRESLRGSGD